MSLSHVCAIVPNAVTCLHILLHYTIATNNSTEINVRFSNCSYISAILDHEQAKEFHIYAGQVV